MKKAVFSGSFDPFTLAHLDIAKRAAGMFDKLYIAVLHNINKRSVFTVDERISMISDAVAGIENIEIVSFSGLLVDFMQSEEIKYNVRGLRNEADFDYESTMHYANNHMLNGMETVCLFSRPEQAFISSSAVREIAAFGGDISGLVPDAIKNMVLERLKLEK